MRIAMIACPAWANWAPNPALLLLGAQVRREGHETQLFDMNIDAYHDFSDPHKEWWKGEKSCLWDLQSNVEDLWRQNERFFEDYAARVAGFKPQLLTFSINSGSRLLSLIFARLMRSKLPNTPIVFGGADCFRSEQGSSIMIPGVVDALCPGEGDLALPDLVNTVAAQGSIPVNQRGFFTWDNGALRDNGDPSPPKDLDALAPISLDGVDLSRYILSNRATMMISRGCINRCTFCNEGPNFGRFRTHSPEWMIAQIKAVLPNLEASGLRPHICFNDSLINGDMAVLDRLCSLIIEEELQFSWGGFACVRKEMDQAFLETMRRAGCVEISWGIESGSENVLSLMRKRFTPAVLQRVITDTAKVGLGQYSNLIVGFPGEGPQEFAETLLFLVKNRGHLASLGLPIFVPRKNTPVYRHPDKFHMASLHGDEWTTTDGKNTPKIRLLRRQILSQVLGDKMFTQGREENLANRHRVDLSDPELEQEYTAIFHHFLRLTGKTFAASMSDSSSSEN